MPDPVLVVVRTTAHKAESAVPPLQVRLRPEWQGPTLDPQDGLGLLATSHHTIVTRDPQRLRHLYVDLLGARQIGADVTQTPNCDSTYIVLPDTVLEMAVPRPESDYFDRVANGKDFYSAVSYQVADVGRTFRHLAASGVNPIMRGDMAIIRPEDGFGVEWRFMAACPYPSAERRSVSLAD